MYNFSILITTKNRLEDLKNTLQNIKHLIDRNEVECIICDDGSTDKTSDFLITNYPNVNLIHHSESLGYILSRNELLRVTTADYAITLDDDSHIVSQNSLSIIEDFFKSKPKCAVIALRIFWGLDLIGDLSHSLAPMRVKGFVGCGHVWNMKVWETIPDYPEWFVFYGEEDFASFQLFKSDWEVWFVPDVLVHHRVDIKTRRTEKDYAIRLRRSLRSGWYLYALFYPFHIAIRRFLYTLWVQIKTKAFKGDLKAIKAIFQALVDVIFNISRLTRNQNRLTSVEFERYQKLPATVLYWSPKQEK